MKTLINKLIAAGILSAAWLLSATPAFAHCDSMDGPVVHAAKVALEKKDVTPVLKWITKDGEAEVRAAFAKTLIVRTKGTEACELADQFFFETLVRVHRAGEGEPFTGLKPAGTDPGPGVAKADKALESGSVDHVVQAVTDEAEAGIRQRFAEAREKRKHADDSVEAGREFVAAYVAYVHYVEGLHEAAENAGANHAATAAAHEHGEAVQPAKADHEHAH